jgi:hypothetical protein
MKSGPGSPLFDSCVFQENTARGGMHMRVHGAGFSVLINCIFKDSIGAGGNGYF